MVCPSRPHATNRARNMKAGSTRSGTQLVCSSSRTPPLWMYTTTTRCPTHGGLLRIHSHASTPNTHLLCNQACLEHSISLQNLSIQTGVATRNYTVMPPRIARAGHMPPTGLRTELSLLGRHHCGCIRPQQSAQDMVGCREYTAMRSLQTHNCLLTNTIANQAEP